MKIDDIAIYTGKPDFEFKPIRRLEVKCEASNALMPAPTIEEANGRLRALAAKAGANAVVEVEYNSGISFTSWKSLKATGMAGTRISDEVQCASCAETIKRAALKCRYCGADREPTIATEAAPAALSEREGAPLTAPAAAAMQEPLRDNNNPMLIVGLCIVAFMVLSAIIAAAG